VLRNVGRDLSKGTATGWTIRGLTSSAVGHERVELYLYSHYVPYGLYRASVPVQGWPLPLPFLLLYTHTGVLFPCVKHPPFSKPTIPAYCNEKSCVIYSCRNVWRILMNGQLCVWWATLMFCALVFRGVIFFSVLFETLNNLKHWSTNTLLQGVSGGIVNILGSGIMDYSE